MANIRREPEEKVHLVYLTKKELKLIQQGLKLLEKLMETPEYSEEDIKFVKEVINYSPKLGF